MANIRCQDAALTSSLEEDHVSGSNANAFAAHRTDCPDCCAFAYQLREISRMAALVARSYEAELPLDFESRLVARMLSHRH